MNIPLGNDQFMSEEQFRSLPVEKSGYRELPDGRKLRIIGDVTIYPDVVLESHVSIAYLAFISSGCKLGEGSSVGYDVHLEPGVEVGSYCYVGNNSHIETGAQIASHVYIGSACVVRKRAVIDRFVDLGNEVIVGEGAYVGEGVKLPFGTHVPAGTRIQEQPLVIYGTHSPIVVISRECICIGLDYAPLEYWKNGNHYTMKQFSPKQIDEYKFYFEFVDEHLKRCEAIQN